MEEYVEAVAFEIQDLNTSASNSNMADLSQPMSSDPSNHCQELIYRLDALRRKESFFDVTVSVKNKEFKAHKLMLAAASPFFLSLLVSDMREGKEQFIRIELEEATGSVMEEVLKYVYTGDVAITKENAHDLVAVADYLLLPVLDGCIYGLFDFHIILYKLDESSCEAVADPPTRRIASCLVTDKRHLYLVGGMESCSYEVSKRVERFNPVLATWEEVAAMNEARFNAFGAGMNGKIYIAGGVNDSEGHLTVLKSCEVYDPSTNEWQIMSNLKVCRQAANMVCVQEALYVVGGSKDLKSSSRELSVEVFQLGACEWKSKSTIPTNFEHENSGDQKKEIHHKACLAVIHKSLLEKLFKL